MLTLPLLLLAPIHACPFLLLPCLCPARLFPLLFLRLVVPAWVVAGPLGEAMAHFTVNLKPTETILKQTPVRGAAPAAAPYEESPSDITHSNHVHGSQRVLAGRIEASLVRGATPAAAPYGESPSVPASSLYQHVSLLLRHRVV